MTSKISRDGRASRARAVALALLLPAAASVAAESRCGPHVAALYPYAPFFQDDPKHGPVGIDKEMFDELGQRSGCELRLVVESRVRIWDQMRHGAVGLTLSAVPTPERREFAEIIPYAQGRYHLMLRREHAARVRSLAAFEADPALRLLVVKGYAHGATLDAALGRLRAQGRLLEVGDFPTVLRMARIGRADALLALPSGWSLVESALPGSGAWVPVDVAPADRSVAGLALSLRMPEADRQRLRRALQAMQADGTLAAILRRHLGQAGAAAAAYSGD